MKRYWAGVALGAAALMSGIALTATAAWLIATASFGPPVLTLMVAVVAVRAFGLARPVLRYLERLATHDAALRMLGVARASVFQALIPLVPARLNQQRAGEVLIGLVSDVDSVQDRLLRVRAPVAISVIVGIASTALLTWLYLPAGIVIAATLLLAGLGGWRLSAWSVRRSAKKHGELRAQLGDEVVTLLRAAPELTINGTLTSQLERCRETNAALSDTQRRAAWGVGLGSALTTCCAGIALIAIGWLGAAAVANNEIRSVIFAVLVLAPLAMFEATAALPAAAATAAGVRASERRLAELTTQPAAVVEPQMPARIPAGPIQVRLSGLKAGWDTPVLNDINLELPPGRRVAICGPSGVGKSTLAAVLLRFLDPHAGSYQINGRDATTLASDEVRRIVGLIDSHAHIFASTVRENLKLARPTATDAELQAALAAARLPLELDTWLGEGGVRISGGERQRIGLARAWLADFPVLILDEPTAHLDAPTARAVLSDLFTAMAGKTIVLITHHHVHLDLVDEVVTLAHSDVLTPRRPGRMVPC